MDKEIQNDDKIFSSMREALDILNEDERHIADITRELESYEIKKDNDFKKVRQYAANYFTKEKISELHKLYVDVLKSSDFSEDIFIEKFSDATKIKIDDINFLIEIQNNIIEVQEKLSSNEVLSSDNQIQVRGMSKIMSAIADILSRKDGANYD